MRKIVDQLLQFFHVTNQGRRLFRSAAVATFSALLTFPSCAQAPSDGSKRLVQIKFIANEPTTLKEFATNDGFSETVVGSIVPSTTDRPIDPLSGPVKIKLPVSARWADDKRQTLTLNLSGYSSLTKLDARFFRYTISQDNAGSLAIEMCRFTSPSDSETLLSRLFACKDIIAWLDNQSESGTQRYYTALRGWFYASRYLFELADNGIHPYEMDAEIVDRMERLLNDPAQIRAAGTRIDVLDIRNKLREYRIADIQLINEVNKLRRAGRLEEAKRLIDFIVERFPALQQAAASPVVAGVDMDLLKRSDAELQTRARDRGIILPPSP